MPAVVPAPAAATAPVATPVASPPAAPLRPAVPAPAPAGPKLPVAVQQDDAGTRRIRIHFEITIEGGKRKSPRASSAGASTAAGRRKFRPIDIWKRYLPPVRLVWIFLGVLTVYGGAFASALAALPFVAIPIVSVCADLGFQRARFVRLRFPDTALVTSLFLVVLIWPGAISLALIAVTVATVGFRHLLRSGGHPWFNPAALGLTAGFFLFGVQTSWHVGIDQTELILIAVFGFVLILRARHTWRFPVAFFAIYVPISMAAAAALGSNAHALWHILWTTTLAAQPVFYGLFMVTEPRTAPSARPAMLKYGLLVGIFAAGLPLAFSYAPYIGALGAVAPFLALFVGNFYTLTAAGARGARAPRPAAAPPRMPAPSRLPSPRRLEAPRPALAAPRLGLEATSKARLGPGSQFLER